MIDLKPFFSPSGYKILVWGTFLVVQFSSVQSLSHVQLFETPWTAE